MYDIEASVYTQKNQFHYVKLEIDGVYISGIKVSESNKDPGTLWIQMPSYRVGRIWKRYIETSNDSKLGQAMYKAIEDTVGPQVLGESHEDSKMNDDTVFEVDPNEEIDLDSIPF